MTEEELQEQWEFLESAPQNSRSRAIWLAEQIGGLQANQVITQQEGIDPLDGEDDPALISAKVDEIIAALVAAGVLAEVV